MCIGKLYCFSWSTSFSMLNIGDFS
jgi:hypothetical protein